MKATIKFLFTELNPVPIAYATVKDFVKPGDFVPSAGEVVQVNQSTCFFFESKIVGKVNKGVDVKEGEEVELVFDCKAEERCSYPFCGKACPGSKTQFRIFGKEDRKY